MITLRAPARNAGVVGLSLALAASPALAMPAERAAPSTSASASGAVRVASAPGDQRAPALRVRTVRAGLDLPWDLTFLPNGGMLYTQRERKRISYRGPQGRTVVVADSPANVWAAGETGMMGILAAKRFRTTRQFYTCHGSNAGGSPDVRVVLWRLADNYRSARRVRNIVTNLPASSGRHGGCRLRYGSEGALYVGTGDAAQSPNAQNLRSGGGKVLRVVPGTGRGWRTNTFHRAANAMKRRVFTYGHRNVQGLALRADGLMWSVEHGTYRDDEANLLRNGGNYGWRPGPGYDESSPMTDFSLPGQQIGARWRSGSPTIAPSGATFLRGKKWRGWQGALALGVLGDAKLTILRFGSGGRFIRSWTPPALDGRFGRLRSVVMGPNNDLYVTTANGGGNDRILRVTPR